MRRILPLSATIAFLLSLTSCVFAAEVPVAQADANACLAYTSPVWSPNGKSLAYVGTTATAGKTVYVSAPSGGKWTQKAIAENADWPVWASDSKQVIVNQGGMVFVDAASGKVTKLTKDLGYDEEGNPIGVHQPLSMSPTGRHILYQCIKKDSVAVRIRDIKTGKEVTVSSGGATAWTSDGKLLAVQGGSETEQPVLKLVDPATGSARTVLQGQIIRYIFAPKGAGYAWVHIMDNAPKGKGVYKVDLKKGTLVKQVALSADEVCFSPDARQFVFITQYSPRAGVEPKSTLYLGETRTWTFKIASKDVSKTGTGYLYAQWAPDSKSVAYVSEAGDIRQMKL